MTPAAHATRRDDPRRAPRRASSRARRDPQPADQDQHPTRDERDDRDEVFTGLSPSPRPPRTVTKRKEGNPPMSTARTPARRLLTVAQAAERLGTTERFPRRLIAERRITFVKLGSHVRIPETALDDLIAAGTVTPVE
jgi:excisionase family DNA binding protein